MTITIYHNPNCGTSRTVLATIRESGQEPKVIQYLKTPPSRAELQSLVKKMGVRVRDVVRSKEKLYGELNLENASDDQLLDAMAAHPILINRPIVVSDKGARLCRPADAVKELL